MTRIAALAYPLTPLTGLDAYYDKARQWLRDATGRGCELVVFPEYGAMELSYIAGRNQAAQIESSLVAASRYADRATDMWRHLAMEFSIHLLAPSGPVFDPGPRPVNRAVLFGPDGVIGHQDKQMMTRFERDVSALQPGIGLKVFDTPLGRLGVLICYDSEFPLLGRALAEAGAEIILVPSCTDSHSGYTRVRVGCMARALENQCVVVHASIVGPAQWCPVVDLNIGAAAIYGPPDLGFASTGVLAETALNEPGIAIADIDLGAVARVRRDGQVQNFAQWPDSLRSANVNMP